MKTSANGKLLVLISWVTAFLVCMIINLSDGWSRQVVVNDIGYQTETCRCLVVTTDGKRYEIKMTGGDARPFLIQKLPLGKKITIQTKGIRIDCLGVYPKILTYKQN